MEAVTISTTQKGAIFCLAFIPGFGHHLPMNDTPDRRLDYPATGRNREAILKVLTEHLSNSGTCLEIGAGSGQHAVHFQPHFPGLRWQTSDPFDEARRSIAAWISHEGLDMPAPLDLDATGDWQPQFKRQSLAAIISINMIHISPWSSCQGLMRNAGIHLKPGGILYLYGPFIIDDMPTAPSNIAFDGSLKSRNSDWGLRHLSDVCKEAEINGLVFKTKVSMPANNFSVIFERQ